MVADAAVRSHLRATFERHSLSLPFEAQSIFPLKGSHWCLRNSATTPQLPPPMAFSSVRERSAPREATKAFMAALSSCQAELISAEDLSSRLGAPKVPFISKSLARAITSARQASKLSHLSAPRAVARVAFRLQRFGVCVLGVSRLYKPLQHKHFGLIHLRNTIQGLVIFWSSSSLLRMCA